MRALITGATGQLGQTLIPLLLARGDELVLLVRDAEKARKLFPNSRLEIGDVTTPGLARIDLLEPSFPGELDAVYHLAADINLGKKHAERTWNTNFGGTQNVVNFCEKNRVPHLYYVSTAYTEKRRNPYENSKAEAEMLVNTSPFKKTIFKPGIILPCLEDIIKPSTGAVYQFARGICSVHKRAEVVRRAVEGTLRLPILEPKFRLKGNADGEVNVVPVDQVAGFIAKTQGEGKFWLTNPLPPTVGEITQWIGQAMYVEIEVLPEFQMSAIEELFHRIAAPFMSYLEGDVFKSDLPDCPPITAYFIRESVKHSLL
jgi:nucleoside-diphosphate-sugar epimerase